MNQKRSSENPSLLRELENGDWAGSTDAKISFEGYTVSKKVVCVASNVGHTEGIGAEGRSCPSDRCNNRWGVARDGDVSDAGACKGIELG